jgi:inosine-uridine nucleoside N-ribohydrolase
MVCQLGIVIAFLSGAPIDVWLDVDTANGVGDVDDGLMMIQCFHSPELAVHGISVVFGNTTLERAVPIAREITDRFGPAGMPIHAGAASAEDVDKETDAVRALAGALADRPLTLLAVGPVTNVAGLVRRHPELVARIKQVVVVAGRRPGQKFVTSPRQLRPHPDANFEKDPEAMRVLLETSIPLVLAPWEVSSHVWLSREDLKRMSADGGSGAWIADTSQYWINLWGAGIDSRGFNPFDTLAAGWLTHPELIESERVKVRIIDDEDDRATPAERSQGRRKPYLVTGPIDGEGREVIYCYRPKPEFHDILVERLSEPVGESADPSSP